MKIAQNHVTQKRSNLRINYIYYLGGGAMQSDNFRRLTVQKTLIFYENDDFDHVGL